MHLERVYEDQVSWREVVELPGDMTSFPALDLQAKKVFRVKMRVQRGRAAGPSSVEHSIPAVTEV